MNGWVKFHRAMLDHPVWSLSDGQRVVWLTILAMANHRPGWWFDGEARVAIPTGSFLTSQDHLAKEARVGRQVVRGALRSLECIGSISTKVKTKGWTLIEVINWALYQGEADADNQEANQEPTKSQPRGNHNGRREEGKKVRREKEETMAARRLSWADFLDKHPGPEENNILNLTARALSESKTLGAVPSHALASLAVELDGFPFPIVLQSCRTYLAKDYAARAKGGRYLLGIIQGEMRAQEIRAAREASAAPTGSSHLPEGFTQRTFDMAKKQLAEMAKYAKKENPDGSTND